MQALYETLACEFLSFWGGGERVFSTSLFYCQYHFFFLLSVVLLWDCSGVIFLLGGVFIFGAVYIYVTYKDPQLSKCSYLGVEKWLKCVWIFF